MIKKYIMIIAMLLAILIFTSTSTASFLFSEGKIYERLPENSPLKTMLDRLYQVAYNNDDDDVALDADEEDDETDDEDDGEEDDDDSEDGLKEDVLLPKTGDVVGEITPDDGNEPVYDMDETTTIDSDGNVGGATQGEWTVDSDGDEGAAINEKTIDEDGEGEVVEEGEWTVDEGEWTVKLERFVKIVTELNGNLGAMLKRVIERTVATDENGISSPGSGGSAENEVDVVVVTDGDQ